MNEHDHKQTRHDHKQEHNVLTVITRSTEMYYLPSQAKCRIEVILQLQTRQLYKHAQTRQLHANYIKFPL